MKNLSLWILLLISTSGLANEVESSSLAEAYIDRYKDISIQEMRRTGIPASIKLAQGLLESDWGRSDLARVANNHFGIKCGGSWDGKRFYKEDDDRNASGKLIESCFRVFKDDRHSYKAHSEFLKNPKKAYRYGFLFSLPSDDYRSWANGLLDAGYATDPRYPQKLITVIEKYDLHLFDQILVEKDLANNEHIPSAQPILAYEEKEKHFASIPERNDKREFKLSAINRVPMTYVEMDIKLSALAEQVGLNVDLLILYNDGYTDHRDVVKAGAIIYLQKKKRSYIGPISAHVFLEGETLEEVSQLYGIRLQNLRAKNKLPLDAIPFVGENLQLRKTVSRDARPAFTRADGRVPQRFLDRMETKGSFSNVKEQTDFNSPPLKTPKIKHIEKSKTFKKKEGKVALNKKPPSSISEKKFRTTDPTKEML